MKTFLETCTGANNVVDPVKLDAGELEYAHDVVVSEAGRIDRADGHTQIASLTNGHSLFCSGRSACLVAQGTALYNVAADNSLAGLRSSMSGGRLDYTRHGSEVFYTNAVQHGIVRDNKSWVWAVGEYTGSKTSRHFEPAVPVFEHIEAHIARMFGSIDNTLFESEPGEFGLFCLREGRSFSSKIIMLKSVAGGLFVSTLDEMYFLRGTEHADFVEIRVADYPAYEWSDAADLIEGLEIGLQIPGQCALWNSPEGPCLGTADGSFLNLVKSRIVYPDEALSGATLLRGYRLIASLDSSFTSDTNLKVGDIGGKATSERGAHFNSYCKRGRDFLACSDTGLFRLGGTTRDGVEIAGTFETRTWNMGWPGPSRPRFLYIEGEFNGDVTIEGFVDGESRGTKTVTPKKDGQQQIRTTFDRVKGGEKWKFKISSSADFSVEKFQVLPVLLAKGR